MKTTTYATSAGLIVKVPNEVNDTLRAVRRVEKKTGAHFTSPIHRRGYDLWLADCSPAVILHHRRAAARSVGQLRHTERCRKIQRAAAKAITARLRAAGHETFGLGAFEALKKYEHALPKGAGKLRRLAAGYFTVIPATTPRLP